LCGGLLDAIGLAAVWFGTVPLASLFTLRIAKGRLF